MKKILSFVLVTTFFTTHQILAVPAIPHPVNYELPDGEEITIQLRGDEWVNWAETPDGFTLLLNSGGFWEYAVVSQSGDLQLSGVLARSVAKRTTTERIFLRNLPTGLRYSDSQIETMLEFRDMRDDFLQQMNDEPQRFSGNDTIRIPVILVGFANKPFTKTKEEFEMLFNQVNLTTTVGGEVPGSLHDYFSAISFGQLLLQVDVFGPYTLPSNISTYAYHASQNCGNPRTMARQAVDSAAANGCNFADYAPNSNTVRTVYIIFAGYGAEAGATVCQSIWSHAWSFPAVTHNGKTISRYACSPEYRGNSGTNITHIGVVAHELGHSLLGLPDFYSVNGNAVHLADWCLMASGSWNDGGRTPSNISAWGRVDAGWVPEITISTPQSITLPNPLLQDAVYRVNTTTNNEYYLLENRQRTGWDAFIPSSGMLIYHVDRTNVSVWNNNTVNTSTTRRRNYIKQAGCTAINGCSSGRQTDPWPQPQLGQTEFTDYSVPSMMSWAGNPTGKPILGIVHNTSDRTVSFDFMNIAEYNIRLSANGTYTFPSETVGYEEAEIHTVTIINIGANATGELTVELTGTDADAFTLSETTIPSIDSADTGSFTITPNIGLALGTYTATVTVSGDNDILRNFNVSFTVRRGAGESVQSPSILSVTFNSITIAPVTPPENGQTVEYAIRTEYQNITSLTWQTGLTFNNLEPQTTYLIHARSAENTYFLAGTPSGTLVVTPSIPANIADIEKEIALNVYPNPIIDGKFIVEIPEDIEDKIIQIYDVVGKLVLTRAVNRPKTEINISHLPNGTYIVKVGTVFARIIKQ
jgi:M6 family metalloprotease-like protein